MIKVLEVIRQGHVGGENPICWIWLWDLILI